MALDFGAIRPVTSSSLNRLSYMTPCPIVAAPQDLSTKTMSCPIEDLAIEPEYQPTAGVTVAAELNERALCGLGR